MTTLAQLAPGRAEIRVRASNVLVEARVEREREAPLDGGGPCAV
ncbi:MAG: hypothetical protein ACYDHH_13375 [Solirubrobacteraceae bacterium]